MTMKTILVFYTLLLMLFVSCARREENIDSRGDSGDVAGFDDSKNTGETPKKDTTTPEELYRDRQEHPEKYLVTKVVLDVNVKPNRYNVVLINNSPYKLISGTVQVDYDVIIGSSRLNTIQKVVEFRDVESGDTSVIGSVDERGRKDHLIPISRKVVSSEFKIRNRR